MDWLETDIIATRSQFNGDSEFIPVTRKQVQKLIICFKHSGIHDRDLRIGILREWTGIERLPSTNKLTLHTAGVMIDYLCVPDGGLSFDGLRFIIRIASKVKARITYQPV